MVMGEVRDVERARRRAPRAPRAEDVKVTAGRSCWRGSTIPKRAYKARRPSSGERESIQGVRR